MAAFNCDTERSSSTFSAHSAGRENPWTTGLSVCWRGSGKQYLEQIGEPPMEAHFDQYSPVSAHVVTIREAAFRLKMATLRAKPLTVKNMAVVKSGLLNEQQ
jgi:hypothetical protein